MTRAGSPPATSTARLTAGRRSHASCPPGVVVAGAGHRVALRRVVVRAAYAGAPRWARRYYRFSTAMLSLVGAGLLAIGAAFAAAVLRR